LTVGGDEDDGAAGFVVAVTGKGFQCAGMKM
jgi:hypothetical protein